MGMRGPCWVFERQTARENLSFALAIFLVYPFDALIFRTKVASDVL